MFRPRFVSVAAAVLVPLSALASVVLSLSFEELSARAPLVVHATVHRSEAGWDTDQSKIWTWTELVVRETLKGPAGATVVVKQPGGQVGELGMAVAGAARFVSGEEVVLFLEPAPDEKGTWVPVSMSASKISLVERLGARVAVRDLSGLGFARPGPAGVVQPVDESERLGPADAFLARLRVAVKGGAR